MGMCVNNLRRVAVSNVAAGRRICDPLIDALTTSRVTECYLDAS